MTRYGRWLLGPVFSLCCACGIDLGGGAGMEVRSANAVGYGRIAASTKLGAPLNNHGLLIGASLESRAESNVGARYDTGVLLGWGTGPDAIGGRWGLEMFGEFGSPIQQAIFRDGNLFVGAGVAVPFHFAKPRHVLDLNDSTWIAATRLELVPMLRGRAHFDRTAGQPYDAKVDFTAGVAFRFRMFSDLL